MVVQPVNGAHLADLRGEIYCAELLERLSDYHVHTPAISILKGGVEMRSTRI